MRTFPNTLNRKTKQFVRSIYRRIRDFAYETIPPRQTPDGFWYIGSLDRFRRSPDEIGTIRAIKILAPFLQRFLNAGANSGYYALLACKYNIQVIAFEPETYMYARLRKNIALNDANCMPIPVALSNTNSHAYLYGTGTAGSLIKNQSTTPKWDRQPVITEKIDNFLAPCQGKELWLMDCEGAEPNILFGAENYIKNHKPLIILEYMPSRDYSLWQSAIALLNDFGYDKYLICSHLSTNDQTCEPGNLKTLNAHDHGNIMIWSSANDADLTDNFMI